CDDFEDGNSAGWSTIEQNANPNQAGTAGPGTWAVATDTARDGTPTLVFQQQNAVFNSYHYQWVSALAATGPLTDQTVSAWIKPTSPINDNNHRVGVCARFTTVTDNDSTSSYCFFIQNSDATATSGRGVLSKKPLNRAETTPG